MYDDPRCVRSARFGRPDGSDAGRSCLQLVNRRQDLVELGYVGLENADGEGLVGEELVQRLPPPVPDEDRDAPCTRRI
eukprot:1180215-Prorocentrum_minimum.AAC.4